MFHLSASFVTWHGGQLDFLAKSTPLGWKNLSFAVTVDGMAYASEHLAWRRVPSRSGMLMLVADMPGCPVEQTIIIEADEERNAVKVRRRYRNRSTRPVWLSGVIDGQGRLFCPRGRAFHIENIKQMFYEFGDHPELNPRKDARVAYGTAVCGSSYWAELGPSLTYGRSEDQPYPAIFLASPPAGMGLVDAQGTQDRWYREVTISADGDEGFAYTGAMNTRGVSSVRLNPSTVIDGEMTWFQLTPQTDIQKAFTDYNTDLSARYDFRAAHSPNRREIIWGSWNFGIFFDCNDELVMENARILRAHHPRVKWVQIDEGWAATHKGALGCPLYEGADKKKFPRGLRAVSDDVRALGLRPSIWCGMTMAPETQVLHAHPEWILRKRDGSPHMAGIRLSLDYSLEEVRDFLVKTYRTVIQDWGYDGIKLDFWTNGFEDHAMIYANDEFTSLELRNWWLSTLRGLLPEDGYLQTGCNIASVSPFLSRFVDNIRYGVDIGEGNDWQPIIDTASWLAALSVATPGQIWLPNTDAIGAMKELNPAQRRAFMSFCGVTGSALEFGGDLRNETPEESRDAQRILAGVQIGRPFRPIDFGSPADPVPPTLWYCEGGLDTSDTEPPVGFLCAFDWSGKGLVARNIPLSALGLTGTRYRAVNYWSGESFECTGAVPLPAIPAFDVCALHLYPIGQ